MSTNAAIIVKIAEKRYAAIYTHWDGYPSHHARILFESYNTQKRAEALIALGWISILDHELCPPSGVNSFDERIRGYCLTYHRDRDEDLRVNFGKTPAVACRTFWNSFRYVFENGHWHVSEVAKGGFRHRRVEDFRDAEGNWHDTPVAKLA